MAELTDGCVKPAQGPLISKGGQPVTSVLGSQEVGAVIARVGQEAIDFEANAFVAGKGFQALRLSEYKGKWIVLCFYPGDFTFV